MPATVAGIHLGPDTHANRPAANASGLPVGSLYVCSDHGIIYQTDGSTWSTWATLGGGAVAAEDVSITDAGAHFTGTDVEAALQELGASGGGGGLGAWTTYTPAWTTTGTSPSIGNGTLTGRYKELDGTTLAVSINLLFGTTTSKGTGNWNFGLPAGFTTAGSHQVMYGHALDAGAANWIVIAQFASGATGTAEVHHTNPSGNAGNVGEVSPFSWGAAGDALRMQGILEVA